MGEGGFRNGFYVGDKSALGRMVLGDSCYNCIGSMRRGFFSFSELSGKVKTTLIFDEDVGEENGSMEWANLGTFCSVLSI